MTPFDSLIVAAGAEQSYFGNDEFAEFAPGMKTIDDALELRGRILGAFEQAELYHDPASARAAHLRRRRRRPHRGRARRADRRACRSHPDRRVPATSTPATPASSCSMPPPRCSCRWGRSSASRRSAGSRSWASRSSSTRWSPSRRRRPRRQGEGRHRAPHRLRCARCGRPVCRPARWARCSPSSPRNRGRPRGPRGCGA